MKFIKLLGAAYVGGMLRMPHEGVLSLDDDVADRLVEAKLGTDVTDDFTAKQKAGTTTEAVTLVTSAETAPADPPHESQASVVVSPLDPKSPAPASAAADKE